MRVALVHDFLIRWGGAERVLEVFSRIFPNAPIFTLLADPEITERHFGDRVIHPARFINYIWRASGRLNGNMARLMLPLYPACVESWNLRKFDLVISSTSAFACGIVPRVSTFHISYCHTPARWAWQNRHETRAGLWDQPLTASMFGIYAHWFRLWNLQAMKRIDLVLSNSHYTARRLRRYFGVASQVLHPPVDYLNNEFIPSVERDWSREPFDPQHDYFVVLGFNQRYKAFDLAVQASRRLNWHLVVIGSGDDMARLRSCAGPRIHFTGHVSEESKLRLLASAVALIVPNDEDFSIAAVEAAAQGTPIIAHSACGAWDWLERGVTGFAFTDLSGLIQAARRGAIMRPTIKRELLRKQAERFSLAAFSSEFHRILQTELKAAGVN